MNWGRLRKIAADELLQARIEYYFWITAGIALSWVWRSFIPWVVFMSVYAIIKNQANIIKTLKVAREVADQAEPKGYNEK